MRAYQYTDCIKPSKNNWGDLLAPNKTQCLTKALTEKAPKNYVPLHGDFEGICLTERQYFILQQFIAGGTCQMIADQNDLSVRTVEEYSRQLRNKLKFNTKADMIRYFIDPKNQGTTDHIAPS